MSVDFAHLAPQPQRVTPTAANLDPAQLTSVDLLGAAQPLLFAAQRAQAALARHGLNVPISAAPTTAPALRLVVDPAQVARAQGYKLTVDAHGVLLVGNDPAGLFYAVCTLSQLLDLSVNAQGHLAPLPGVQIVDWPDYPNRGVMLDVSRTRVPTMETLYATIDQLASLKINQIQLYTEHTFAYRGHEVVWQDASPITGEEVLALDAYCRARHVELVPNQNSFGHMHRWLIHPQYNQLAESAEGIEHSFSTQREPFSLCPGDPGSIALLEELYSQLLPHFSSRQFNVGLDETFDLGQGRSKAECEARGTGRVYLDFLLKVYALCRRHGVTMQFWSDIIVRDEPGLVAELPQDVIALEWGYEAGYPFADHARLIAASGRSFYVCPGTSSWNTLSGRTDNALGNIAGAARAGFDHGAIGLLNTDWGDNGHPQTPPISYLGYLAGAAYSWNTRSAHDHRLIPVWLDAHVFRDRSGVMGKLVYDLGNVYQLPGAIPSNSSLLFWLLVLPQGLPPRRQGVGKVTAVALEQTGSYLDTVMAPLSRSRMQRADAALIRDELAWTADMLRVAVRLGLAWVEVGLERPLTTLDARTRHALAGELRPLLDRHAELWLRRSRPGGLPEALSRFRTTLAALEA